MRRLHKLYMPLIMQVLILSLCFFSLKKIPSFSPSILLLMRYSSYIIFGIGIILSIRFNKGKVFFIIFTLTICELVLIEYPTFFNANHNLLKKLYQVICILVPINIVIFSQLKERGIFSLWGKIRIAFFASEIYGIYKMILSENPDIIGIIHYNLPFITIASLPIPQMSFITFFIAISFFVIITIIKRNSCEIHMVGVLISVFLSLWAIEDRIRFSIFFAAAGLILIIRIIEDSYFMAYFDELTGIPSRRALREELLKLGSKYTIAMLDIDFFKKFNDRYGHDVGDEVLKMVAANLEKVTGGGRAFRYGGEEFSIVFPGKAISDVMPHLEDLREQVSKSAYTQKPKKFSKSKRKNTKKLSVTISIGVSEKNSDYKTPNDVMKAADKALYRAKKKGRNCVSK